MVAFRLLLTQIVMSLPMLITASGTPQQLASEIKVMETSMWTINTGHLSPDPAAALPPAYNIK
jgi:hypothetical protein